MTITAKFAGTCRKCGQTINAGDKIEWESGKGATHIDCPKVSEAVKAANDNLIKLSRGQGYGREFSAGQVFRNPGNKEQIIYVVKASKQYISEDGMSFGVGDEQGYIYYATCRPATEEESAKLLAKEAEIKAKKDLENRRKEIAEYIRQNGEFPEGQDNRPEGKTFSDRQSIYGGGDWFVVGSEWIWHVENNGMDGDDWSRNNVRTGGAGGIGCRIAYNAELAAEIEKIQNNLPHN